MTSSNYPTLEQLVLKGIGQSQDLETTLFRVGLEVRTIRKKMSVLPTARESEALPELVFLRDFSKALASNSFEIVEEHFFENEKLEKLVFEELLAGVSADFLKTRIYTNKALISTADEIFVNLISFCTKRLSRGRPSLFLVLNTIMDKHIDFYKTNGKETNLANWAFGVAAEPEPEMIKWVDSLKKGDMIDCVKSYANKQIWSRGVFESQDFSYARVRFFGDITTSFVVNRYFDIRPVGSKSTDYEWRENLKEGDLIDYFNFKNGWALARITSVQTEESYTGEKSKTIEIKKEGTDGDGSEKGAANPGESHGQAGANYGFSSYDDFNGSVRIKIHNPVVDKPRAHSSKNSSQIDDSLDAALMSQEKSVKYAVLRPTLTTAAASVFFVKYINLFGDCGGFDFLTQVIGQEQQVNQESFSQAVFLIKSFADNLVQPFVAKYGERYLECLLEFAAGNIDKNIRIYSQLYLSNFIEAISTLSLRVHPFQTANFITLDLVIKIGVVCLKSEILEKQFFGAKLVLSYEYQLKEAGYEKLRNKLANELIRENVLEKIVKGHPSLIAKSAGILKVLFNDNRIQNEHLAVIWNQISKTDSESRTALVTLMKEISNDMSREHIHFLLMKMVENLEDITTEILELVNLLKRVGYTKYDDCEVASLVNDVTWKMLQSDREIRNDVSKEVMRMFVRYVRTDQLDTYLPKIVGNFVAEFNKSRNLKLLIKFLKEPTVPVYAVTKYLVPNKIIDICVQDLCSKLEFLSRQRVAAAGGQSLGKGPSVGELKPASNETGPVETAAEIQADIKRIFKLLGFFIFPRTSAENELFTFDHFQKVYETLQRFSIHEKVVKDWLIHYLKQSRDSDFTEKCKSFFVAKLGDIDEGEGDDFLTFFVVIFKNVNLCERKLTEKYVKFEVAYQHAKKSFKINMICEEHADTFFGMTAIWDLYFQTQSKKLYASLGKLIAKIYLSPEYAEGENVSLYASQKKSLSQRALKLFKEGSPLSAQKASLLLIQIIRKEEAKARPQILSMSQLREGEKIQLFVEKDIKYLREKFKIRMFENQTLSDLKELIASEYRMSFECVTLAKENGEKISGFDNFQTLAMMNVRENNLILVREADVPETAEIELMNPLKTDFSEQVKLVWKEVFDEHATGGLMSPENLAEFTQKATNGVFCNANEERIQCVFRRFDPSSTGFLDFESFLDFYRECALVSREKQKIVKDNLFALGYGKDLRVKRAGESFDKLNVHNSMRQQLSNDPEFHGLLISYLQGTVVSANQEDPASVVANKSREIDLISRLFELLGPSLSDITDALKDPLKFLSGAADSFVLNYKMTVIHGLLFRSDFRNSFPMLGVDLREDEYEQFVRAFLSKEVFRVICDLINAIVRESNQQSIHFGLSPTIRCIEKCLKVCLTFDSPDFLNDLKNFLTYFSRQRKKTIEKGEAEGVPTVAEKPTKQNEKEVSNPEEVEIATLKSVLSQSEIEAGFLDTVDFGELNKALIGLLKSLNCAKSELSNHQKMLLKSAVISLASSVQLRQDQFSALVHSEQFKQTMVEGLTHERPFYKIYYKNLYSVLTAQFEDVRMKTEFLRILISNIKTKGGEEFSSLVDLACSILAEIGEMKTLNSEVADFIHKEFNFTNLFLTFKEQFLTHVSTESIFEEQEDHLLTSYLAFLEKILSVDEMVLNQLDQETKQLLSHHIFHECLFQVSNGAIDFSRVKCHSRKSRSLAFGLLQQILKNNTRLNIHFMVREIAPLVRHIPIMNATGAVLSEFDKKQTGGFLGLKNLGCVCYMLATLQQFYCTPAFRYGILMGSDGLEEEIVEVKGKKIDDNYFHQFQRMMGYLDYSERRDFSPLDFCLSYKDYSGQPLNVMIQQDADEFLKFLVDKVENSLKKSPLIGILNSVYLGKICNVIKCKGCGYVKTNEENFYNLSLEVKNMRNTTESFDKLVEAETISDYTCDSCKNKVDISKQAVLKTLPNVLFLSLKKMCFDLELLINVKIHSRYEFPSTINLRKYMYVPESVGGEEAANAIPVETTDQKPQADEDFEYKLVGVVIHKGNAEYGHYTSLINANRGDPARKEVTQDKWFEFDDSRVTLFDMRKFDEECFGTVEEKEFAAGMMNEPSNSKSAYLLVYDKVRKNDLVFNFTEENLKTKDLILQNLVDPSDFTFQGNELRTGFYNLKQYIPEPYKTEIWQDNRLLILEQHLLSRTFTRSMAEIFSSVDLSLGKDEGQSEAETKNLNEKRIYAETVLQSLPYFLSKIYCATSENEKIYDLVRTIEKALAFLSSVKQRKPELGDSIDAKIFNFFKDQIVANYTHITNAITGSNDQFVQIGLCEYLVKVTTITLKHFGIVELAMPQPGDTSLAAKTASLCYQIAFGVGSTFSQLDGSVAPIRKNARIFLMAFRLAHENVAFLHFFATYNMMHILIDVYLKVDCTRVNAAERALAPMLKLIQVLFAYETQWADSYPVFREYLERVNKLEIVLKAVKEDYKFEEFDAVKNLAFVFCANDRLASELIVCCCLKLMTNLSESEIIGCLEVFRAVLYINDSLTLYRIQLVLGIPRLSESTTHEQAEEKSFQYGLMRENSLKKPVWNYVSPFGLEKGILELIVTLKEMHENYVMLLMNYLTEYMLTMDHVFFYVIHLQPPNYICATFYDWFLIYCEHHLKYESNLYSGFKSELFMKRLNETPDKIYSLGNKIRALLDRNGVVLGEKKLFATGSNPYVGYVNYYSSDKEGNDLQELWSFRQNYLIGKTISYKLLKKVVLDEQGDDKLKIKFHLVRVAMMPSRPTGQTNLSVPSQMLMSDLSINTFSKLNKDFADFVAPKGELHPREQETVEIDPMFEEDEETHTSTKFKKPVKQQKTETVVKLAEDSKFLNVDYIFKISVSNSMPSGYYLKFEVEREGPNKDFDECRLLVPVKGNKSNYLVHTVCLNGVDKSFKGLKVKLSWRRTVNANIKFYENEFSEEMKEVFSFND